MICIQHNYLFLVVKRNKYENVNVLYQLSATVFQPFYARKHILIRYVSCVRMIRNTNVRRVLKIKFTNRSFHLKYQTIFSIFNLEWSESHHFMKTPIISHTFLTGSPRGRVVKDVYLSRQSHRCGFEPTCSSVTCKTNQVFCLRVVRWFFSGISHFCPTQRLK